MDSVCAINCCRLTFDAQALKEQAGGSCEMFPAGCVFICKKMVGYWAIGLAGDVVDQSAKGRDERERKGHVMYI